MNVSFGRHLDDREYEQRIVALHDSESPRLSKSQQTALRRQELELTIDYKLGLDFPAERREALWLAQQRVHRKQIPVALLAFARKAMGSKKSVEAPLVRLLTREYGKVLTASELRTMLDLPAGFSVS